MRRKQPDPNCEYCGGTGVTVIPAQQRGGDIVDEQEQLCICTTPDESDDYDGDNGGSIGTRPWEPKTPHNDGQGGDGTKPEPIPSPLTDIGVPSNLLAFTH